MTLRDQRQSEFAKQFINHGKFGILHLCPRFGKCRTAIKIIEEIRPFRIIIAYPDNKIRKSWENEFTEMGFDFSDVTFTTFLSLKKYMENTYDLIIIDEIHLLSEAQIEVCRELFENNNVILGLSGTISKRTETELWENLGISVIAEYPIEKAIEEGVIADYAITVVKTPLDDKRKQQYKSGQKTEKQMFRNLSYIIDKNEAEGRNTMFLRLARMRIIQNSIAKMEKTRQLLAKHKNERVLVFCGVTKIADQLGIPSYHSKSTEKGMFESFAKGKGNHMAVVKIGNAGITYKPLNRVIINYFDSNAENLAQKINRCMAMEYNNPDKKAEIYIVSTNEPVEQKWLNKALEFFDKSKIKYV
jgi:superfamily II DNA or RNA helicase